MEWRRNEQPGPTSFVATRERFAELSDGNLRAELHRVLEREARAAGEKLALLAEMTDRQHSVKDGYRNPTEFIERVARCSKRDARGCLDLLDKVDDVPHTLDALANGQLGLGHAIASASIVTEHNRDRAQYFEQGRVEAMRVMPLDWARRYAKRQRDHLTPPEALPSATERRHRERGLRIVHHRDGSDSAIITADSGGIDRLLRLLAPLEGEMSRADRELRRAEAVESAQTVESTQAVESLEHRTNAQRRHDVLFELLSAGANANRAQPIAEIVTVLREDTYGRLRAELGDHKVPMTTVERLGCCARHVRIVIDADGRERNIGTASRVPTRAQRRTLETRDRGCRFPGCGHGPHGLHAHHIMHWEVGGETSLENLVLLCSFHHHAVHEGGFGLRRRRDGTLQFRRPDNSILAVVPYRPGFDQELPLTG